MLENRARLMVGAAGVVASLAISGCGGEVRRPQPQSDAAHETSAARESSAANETREVGGPLTECSHTVAIDMDTTADSVAVVDTPEEAVKNALPETLSGETLQYDRLVANDTGDSVHLFKGEKRIATAQLVRYPRGWFVHHFEYCVSSPR